MLLPGTNVGQAFQPDRTGKSGWKAWPKRKQRKLFGSSLALRVRVASRGRHNRTKLFLESPVYTAQQMAKLRREMARLRREMAELRLQVVKFVRFLGPSAG